MQTKDQWRAADSDLADAGQEPRQQDHHPWDQGNAENKAEHERDHNKDFIVRVQTQHHCDFSLTWLAQKPVTSLWYM